MFIWHRCSRLDLLGGLVFATFYATLGIPIAWFADRYSRRNIIVIGLSIWNLMTILTGMVTNLWQLAATRFLMGAGEACGNPPSNSMVADLYAKDRRSMALSILISGSTIGVFLGYLLGGWINECYGWRVVYFVAGAPGLIIALLFWLTVKEPRRGRDRQIVLFETWFPGNRAIFRPFENLFIRRDRWLHDGGAYLRQWGLVSRLSRAGTWLGI